MDERRTPEYVIDAETNRDRLVDPDAAESYLASIADRTDLRSRGERVSLLRLLGRLDEAAREGQIACEQAAEHGTPRQQVAALIRWAHVLQWRRDWSEADRLFDEATSRAQQIDDPLLEAFAHQHSGRNHIDQGRMHAAIESFTTALALREAHGAPRDQIASSRDALRAAEARNES